MSVICDHDFAVIMLIVSNWLQYIQFWRILINVIISMTKLLDADWLRRVQLFH